MVGAKLPGRRSIRLREFDYTQQGPYFVTICVAGHRCVFGDVLKGEARLSSVGRIAAERWRDLPNHVPGLVLDAWVVMPNHLHGIVVLPGLSTESTSGEDAPRGPMPGSLGAVIGGFKSAVSREASARNLCLARPLWQRNYHERILRSDRELEAIREYIFDNPARWSTDPDHPSKHGLTQPS